MAKKKTGPEAEASPAPLTTDAPPAPQGFFRKLVSQYGGVAMAATLVLCARGSMADHYYVPSESMLPTVKIGDRIIVNKSAFGLRLPATSIYVLEFEDPDRGDVVVLDSPGDGPVLLKRIVGLPGDELEVRDGRILVNGQQFPVETKGGQLYETLDRHTHRVSFDLGGGNDWGPTKIPPREFLVMGDNRGGSRDGRIFGLVPREKLLGRAVRMYLHDSEWVWQEVDQPPPSR
jgi:signal peptidase I